MDDVHILKIILSYLYGLNTTRNKIILVPCYSKYIVSEGIIVYLLNKVTHSNFLSILPCVYIKLYRWLPVISILNMNRIKYIADLNEYFIRKLSYHQEVIALFFQVLI